MMPTGAPGLLLYMLEEAHKAAGPSEATPSAGNYLIISTLTQNQARPRAPIPPQVTEARGQAAAGLLRTDSRRDQQIVQESSARILA